MTFAFIEQHARTWPVRLMCRVLGVSPSGFYAWRSRPESARSASNRQLLDDVQRIHAAHHRRYGAPRCMPSCGPRAGLSAAGGWSA